ncbi:MAG: 50S ribosomal protein L25 [Armatimonadota bacterium]
MRAEQVEIPVAVRSEVGKIASRHLRAKGMIPAVLYGRGAEPVPLAVERSAFSKALSPSAWYHTLISLKVEGADAGQERPTVMIAEVQRDLIGRRVISVDFRRISLSEKIHTHVPVRHIGDSPGVKKGGIVDQVTHEVMVECLPTEMPDRLEVDISGLEIGDSVRVRDIVAVPGVRILAAEDDAVIVISAPVKAEEVAPAPAAEGALVEETPEPEVVGEAEGS